MKWLYEMSADKKARIVDDYLEKNRNVPSILLLNAIKDRIGCDTEEGRNVAYNLFLDLCNSIGGLSLYLPLQSRIISKARAENICNEFRGDNHLELALKYNLSVKVVYSIIKKERLLRRGKEFHAE